MSLLLSGPMMKLPSAGGGYTRNFVDNNGTAKNSFTIPNAFHSELEMVLNFNLNTLSGTKYLVYSGTCVRLTTLAASSKLQVEIFDDASSGRLVATCDTTTLSTGTDYQVHIFADLGVPSFSCHINGVSQTMSASITAGSGNLGRNQTCEVGGTSGYIQDALYSDFWFEIGNSLTNHGYAAFWNGGSLADPATIGSPQVLLGSDMTADERGGNTSQGWNDSYSLGSVSVTTDSATWTDA